MIVDAKQL